MHEAHFVGHRHYIEGVKVTFAHNWAGNFDQIVESSKPRRQLRTLGPMEKESDQRSETVPGTERSWRRTPHPTVAASGAEMSQAFRAWFPIVVTAAICGSSRPATVGRTGNPTVTRTSFRPQSAALGRVDTWKQRTRNVDGADVPPQMLPGSRENSPAHALVEQVVADFKGDALIHAPPAILQPAAPCPS